MKLEIPQRRIENGMRPTGWVLTPQLNWHLFSFGRSIVLVSTTPHSEAQIYNLKTTTSRPRITGPVPQRSKWTRELRVVLLRSADPLNPEVGEWSGDNGNFKMIFKILHTYVQALLLMHASAIVLLLDYGVRAIQGQ
jgi:hypothetical protein